MTDFYETESGNLQAAIDEEIDKQNPSLEKMMSQLVALTKEQLRIAQHSVAGFAPLEEDGNVIRAINVQVNGTLEDLARNPAKARWSAVDPHALFPAGLSDEEREAKFPDGKGLVVAARLTSVHNGFPCALAIDVDGLVGGKNTTAGNGTSHHFIAKGCSSIDVPQTLAGYNSETAQELMKRYPGYTPSSLVTHGVMRDAGKTDVTRLHKDHPALSVLLTALKFSGEDGAEGFANIMGMLDAGEEYIALSTEDVNHGIARAQQIYNSAFNTIDLKNPTFTISRPGLSFNSTDDLAALPEHYLLAALNVTSSLNRDIKPVSSAASTTTVLGHLAAKNSPSVSNASSTLAAASASSQKATVAANILKTEYSVNFTFEVVYRSPKI